MLLIPLDVFPSRYIWHKPSPIEAPGVPHYLVAEINAALAGILIAVAIVMTARLINGLHRRLNGQPKFTD